MIDPCRMCFLYPDDCPNRNGCTSRINYLKLNGIDMSSIKKQKKKKVFDNNYNKNGIRRING